MRFTHLFAVLLAVAGIGGITPVSAATTTATRVAPTAPFEIGLPKTDAEQYRNRNRYRGNYGYRGYRGGYRGYRPSYRSYRNVYRPRYYAPRYRGYNNYRGSRGGCRTVWRYGRAYRNCFRR